MKAKTPHLDFFPETRLRSLRSVAIVLALLFGFFLTNPSYAQIETVRIDESFNPAIGFAGRIIDTARQPDNKTIIGGVFSNVNGNACWNLARFNEDGSLDSTFVLPQVNDAAVKIAVHPDGKIMIAGNFTQINGIVRNKIARLNSDGTLDTSFDPLNSTTGTISAVAVQQDGKILVGGSFSSFRGVGRSALVRLLPDGTVDTAFTTQATGFSASVRSIFVTPLGQIFVAGEFQQVGGQNRANIAELDLSGAVQAFNANASSGTILEVIGLPDGKVMIGGRVSIGSDLVHVGRLTSTGAVDPRQFHPVRRRGRDPECERGHSYGS